MKWHQWSSCNWSNCKKPLHCIEIVYLQLQKKILCVVFVNSSACCEKDFPLSWWEWKYKSFSTKFNRSKTEKLKKKKKHEPPADVKTKIPLSEKCLYHCPTDSCTVEFKVKIFKLIHRFTITFPFCKLHGFY